MNFNEYQTAAFRTWKYGTTTERLGVSDREAFSYLGLGLTGEAGEVVEWIKKHYYHGGSNHLEPFENELGDVLWYLAMLATQYGTSLERIAEINIAKLRARHGDEDE